MPLNNFAVAMHLRGIGSTDVYLRSATRSFTIPGASYTTDALGDLVRAAVSIVCSAQRCTFSMDGEPAEFRFIISMDAKTTPMARIRILEFHDIYEKLPDADGVEVFTCEAPRDEFGRAVLSAANKVLDDYGAAGYATANGGLNAFPIRAVAALASALNANEGPGMGSSPRSRPS